MSPLESMAKNTTAPTGINANSANKSEPNIHPLTRAAPLRPILGKDFKVEDTLAFISQNILC